MPLLVGRDLTAWRSDGTSPRWVALAEAVHTGSPDRLTRRWQADGSGHTRLELAVCTWCVGERGELMVADPVLPQPVATAMERLAWVSSSQERQPISSGSLVLWVWTHGTVRIPLGARLWPQGGPSQ